MAFWLVRTGRHGEQEQEAIDKGVITIGWNELPDLSQLKKEQLDKIYAETYPGEGKNRKANRMGQVWSFIDRIKIGDLVAIPLKTQSSIMIGEVTGNYDYNVGSPNTKHRRTVNWKKILPRSVFDQDILNSLGAFLTVGQVKATNAEQRVRRMLSGKSPDEKPDSPETGEDLEYDLEQISKDSIIKFLERKFTGHDLARLIDGILRAKGYVTQLSPPGPDGGVDILAGSGNLGFDSPRICVQVKSSRTPAGVGVLRELVGVSKNFNTEYGILAAWGGLNSAANTEINRSFFTTRLWDQGEIVNELIANYDSLDDELRSEIPLKRIWAIVEEE